MLNKHITISLLPTLENVSRHFCSSSVPKVLYHIDRPMLYKLQYPVYKPYKSNIFAIPNFKSHMEQCFSEYLENIIASLTEV